MDKPSNVLEFVYYWRSWGWAGYKIGDTFAELSAQHFTPYKNKGNSLCHFEHISRRLLVNSLLMSRDRVGDYIRVFKRFRPLFLKGLSSNLYILALLFGERDNHGIHFKAIFSQGENLLNYQREMIEKVFSCKIYDAYGHMERTIAISQCPAGSYHVHSDYGLAEFLETGERFPAVVSEDEYIAEAIGTGLYNFSMPLIRYKSGDYVKISRFPQKCPCGREFPTIISILGRESDVVITPDGRAITALYVALDRTPGITFGQIIQETRDRLLVKVSCELEDEKSLDKLLLSNLKDFIGETMVINIVHVSPDVIPNATPGKFKSIISNVASATILN